jgi:putative peptidoglycan lipid II flippase
MIATLLSRVLGLGREVIIAARFGTGEDYSAYVAAFKIPDALFLVISGGALGSSLIPVFSKFLGQNEPEKAWRLANSIINTVLAALVVSATLMFIFAPLLVLWIVAPGFSPEKQEFTTSLTRILLVQPILLGLGALLTSILNSMDSFLVPALAPIIYNLSIIFGAAILSQFNGVYGLALGVIIGAALFLAMQIPPIFRKGFRLKPGFDLQAPGLREVGVALLPRLLGQAAVQINFIVITNIASSDPPTVSALNYAFQIFMLPHGLFAWSVSMVAFPAMARLYGAGDIAGLKERLVWSLRRIYFLALPASLGLGLVGLPIVRSILELGSFDRSSTELVSYALAFFAVGLVGYGVTEIVTRAFYAMHDTRTPVLIALLTIALNIGLSISLDKALGHGGLALALAIANTLEALLLFILISRRLGTLDEGGILWLPLLKMTLAANFMGAFLLGAGYVFRVPYQELIKVPLIILTALVIGMGAAVYGLVAYLLNIEEARGLVTRFLGRFSKRTS